MLTNRDIPRPSISSVRTAHIVLPVLPPHRRTFSGGSPYISAPLHSRPACPAQDLPAEDSDDTQISDLIPDSSNLESLQAEITSITDSTTMEAKVTNLKDYSGNDIKNGSNITIHGSMTLLYPFNVQGFYEIKEGDQVEFFISDVSTEDGITVETSYLNLVTAP